MATQGMNGVLQCLLISLCRGPMTRSVHDVAIQKLPVIFCLDRAGLVGDDGPTHHGAYDIAYMRCVPNMIVSAPMNESQLRNLMYYGANWKPRLHRSSFVIQEGRRYARMENSI